MRSVILTTLFGLTGLAGVANVGADTVAAASSSDQPVVILMSVPADAEIWFDGTKTTLTGSLRRFVSPPLASGRAFVYQVRVRSQAAGRTIDDTRRVTVRAGERLAVDFMGEQVRETRGSESAYFEPGEATRPTPYVPSSFSSPRAVPLSPDNSPVRQPYGFGGAIGGG
jgi:uncharacterized protein (TIGR03000 family)